MCIPFKQRLGLVLVVVACCSLATVAAAACHSGCSDALNTYFFSVSKPALSVAGAGREETTRILLQLRQSDISNTMPIVTASKEGVLHNVVHTWRFLQNFALQSTAVTTLNEKAAGQPRRYPIPAYSIKAASALRPTTPATAATATSRHLLDAPSTNLAQLPTHTAPTNVLLLSTGSAVGAVADIMDVKMLQSGDNAEPTITLTLDVVHKPHTVSELQEHPEQTLDSHAHYHYFLPAGVTLDAAKFLALLKTPGAASLADLHVFAKGCGVGAACNLNLACPGEGTFDSTCDCVCPTPGCVSGQVCRAAVGHCDIAEVCVNGACPADTFKLNGAKCPWYPSGHGRHGPYSVDLSSARAVKVSAEEAAARLSSAPAYLREWPSCAGTCIDGMCALRWDHPACCGIHKRSHYEVEEARQLAAGGGAEQGTTQAEGHWEGPEWYCWD